MQCAYLQQAGGISDSQSTPTVLVSSLINHQSPMQRRLVLPEQIFWARYMGYLILIFSPVHSSPSQLWDRMGEGPGSQLIIVLLFYPPLCAILFFTRYLFCSLQVVCGISCIYCYCSPVVYMGGGFCSAFLLCYNFSTNPKNAS